VTAKFSTKSKTSGILFTAQWGWQTMFKVWQ